MPRRVFYSFHYYADNVRASQVRNMGVIEGNTLASDNDWEAVKRGGERAIQNWIDNQLYGCSCTIVLVGTETAGRKWVKYEIEKSWNDGKGVFGIYVHNLKDFNGYQARQGRNPFDDFTMQRDNSKLSSIVQVYNPPYWDSKLVYGYIRENLATWIEQAIHVRQHY